MYVHDTYMMYGFRIILKESASLWTTNADPKLLCTLSVRHIKFDWADLFRIEHVCCPLTFDSEPQLKQLITCVKLCYDLTCFWKTYCPHHCKVSPRYPPAETHKEQSPQARWEYQDLNKAAAYHGPTMTRWGYHLNAFWRNSIWQCRGNACIEAWKCLTLKVIINRQDIITPDYTSILW